MMRRPSSRSTKDSVPDFTDPAVAAVFKAYPDAVRDRLMALRQLIFETAQKTAGVGPLAETLKWGQPSYLTAASKSGTTIRIDQVKSDPDGYAIFVNCQTDLIETYRAREGGALTFAGNRAILFDRRRKIPDAAVRRCIVQALTYHRNKTAAGKS